MTMNTPENNTALAVDQQRLVRRFVLAFNGQDKMGVIQQGNIRYESRNGKFTFEDVDSAIKEHCRQLREQKGIGIYPESCMILSVFEVDA